MEKYNVTELEFCTGCQTDYCVSCVASLLEDSPEGKLLANVLPRFSQSPNLPGWEDLAKFKDLIGPDVDPLQHGLHQALQVAKPFIEMQNLTDHPLSQYEAKMLIIGNVLHDAHEGITGDVSFLSKTEASNLEEADVNLRVVQSILSLEDEDAFLRYYRCIIWDTKGWSTAGRAFTAIEHCGYFLTEMRAWALRNHDDLNDEEKAAYKAMGLEGLRIAAPLLAKHAEEFAYPGHLLKIHSKALADMAAES